MKTLIFICLCVSALCRPVAAVPYSLASREVLRDMPGEVPRLLGEAIDQQSTRVNRLLGRQEPELRVVCPPPP